MKHRTPVRAEAAAHALALMVAPNGNVDERELGVLEQLDAFQRLGVSRQRFLDLAHSCVSDIGAHLGERSWLSTGQMAYIDTLLDAVQGHESRVLVCRLAASVIAADGQVTHDERLVYGHALTRWRISQAAATQAPLRDRN
jgi:tellurite resistance protein